MRTDRRLLCLGLVMTLCVVIFGASIGFHHLAWAELAAPGEQGLILRSEMLASKAQGGLYRSDRCAG
jgi:hypothetical protein